MAEGTNRGAAGDEAEFRSSTHTRTRARTQAHPLLRQTVLESRPGLRRNVASKRRSAKVGQFMKELSLAGAVKIANHRSWYETTHVCGIR